MTDKDWKLVFFGAGVIGGSVGGWIASRYEHTYLLDQGEVAEALKTKGVTLYPEDERSNQETVRVKVIDDLAEVPDADVVVLGVKNYSLDPVAKAIRDKVGDGPVIVAMQNGVENQRILPFGAPEEVRSEVRHCIDSLASDGTGYILAPCHNLQVVTPVENIIAMYDEAWRYGRM